MYTSESYPNFYRVVPSEGAFNPARVALIRHFNWTRVGTIYQNSPRYSLVRIVLLPIIIPSIMMAIIIASHYLGESQRSMWFSFFNSLLPLMTVSSCHHHDHHDHLMKSWFSQSQMTFFPKRNSWLFIRSIFLLDFFSAWCHSAFSLHPEPFNDLLYQTALMEGVRMPSFFLFIYFSPWLPEWLMCCLRFDIF